MENLSKLVGNLILHLYLIPSIKTTTALNSFLENEVKSNKNKIVLLLISILLCTLILPFIIVYSEFELIDRLKWSVYYLLLFILVIVIYSAYHDALLKFHKIKTTQVEISKAQTLQNLEFKTDIDYENLVNKLLAENAYTCDPKDLIDALSNEIPPHKIAITYIGVNGKLSYHNLFFTLHYVFKNGIIDITLSHRKELLNYITMCFTKGEKNIRFKTLNQNYNDWLQKKYHKIYEDEFINKFGSSIQSVKD